MQSLHQIMIRTLMRMMTTKCQEERIEREDHTEDIMAIEEDILIIPITALEIMSTQEPMRKMKPTDSMILVCHMILRAKSIEALRVWKETTFTGSTGLAQVIQKNSMNLYQST
jgi:hypothetical protein